jgi:N-acetyl-anhydromuramyl-L-alanine amidase AmpD
MIEYIDAYIPYGNIKDLDINVPEEIIVHAMGEYILDDYGLPIHATTFLNEFKLSAHILVGSNGDVFRCRADNEFAWHARGHNVNTLGIEFLVQGEHTYGSFLDRIKTPYLQKEQYDNGAEVVREWLSIHNIKRIRKHSTVSPGRKVDPGHGFPFDAFLKKVGHV